jgi:hypothetical protein
MIVYLVRVDAEESKETSWRTNRRKYGVKSALFKVVERPECPVVVLRVN